ncbi:MAG: V-type ATP synthase subunit I [Anaerolineae bacterium]
MVPEQDIVPVTEALAHLQLFHVATTATEVQESAASATGESGEWVKHVSRFSQLEQRILDVTSLLGVEIGPQPDGTPRMVSADVAERDIETLEREAKRPFEELEESRKELEQLRSFREQVAPLVGLDVELAKFREARYIYSMLGSMPLENVERLKTSLEPIPSVLVVLNEGQRLATVALFGLRSDAEILRRAARSAYLMPFELPDKYGGTPAAVVTALDQSINRAREHIAQSQAVLHNLHETRIRRLRHLLWRLRASRKLAETIAGFQKFRYTYLVEGWVPASKVEPLKLRIREVSKETAVEAHVPTRREEAQAPFEFSNPPLIRAFEGLVTTYGYPMYRELDPTPLVALTFPLIFGLMFGDIGHGFVLVLLGLLLQSRKVRALEGLAGLGGVIAVCGVSSLTFGLLYGSLFGLEDVVPALWLRPLERTTDVLVVAIVFGIATLTLGMLYNVLRAVLEGGWGEILFSRNGVAGILFYLSLVGLGASFLGVDLPMSTSLLLPILIAGGALVALAEILEPLTKGESIQKGAVGMAAVEGLFELFETLLSLISNTLSYVRMGAFAVAHGALGLVVFILARLVDPSEGVGYWIVALLGNLLVIGFEGMIVGIQTLRLEYYEFFSKFFTGRGKPYRPLTLFEGRAD